MTEVPRLAPQTAPLICPGHSRPVAGIEFSDELDDGVFLISACHDKTAMIRSGETGDWIGTFEGHKGAVWWAALDRPATRAVTCSADYTAKVHAALWRRPKQLPATLTPSGALRQVWNALTGDELYELKHRKIVRAADWSPDSAHIVTGAPPAHIGSHIGCGTAIAPTLARVALAQAARRACCGSST